MPDWGGGNSILSWLLNVAFIIIVVVLFVWGAKELIPYFTN